MTTNIINISPISPNTPLEYHDGILVKREDLCSPFPGPEFSKIRGVMPHIKHNPAQVIGCLDTLHSKAGWAVAACCAALGKQATVFWPQYKRERETSADLRLAQKQAESFGAKLVALPAGRSAILYHTARKRLAEMTGGTGYLMPNALKLMESMEENAAEVEASVSGLPPEATLVISVSSGTVATGVLRGLRKIGLLPRWNVVLHMGYSRSVPQLKGYVQAGVGGVLDWNRVMIIDEGYGYADTAPKGSFAPFPCNPHYDLKAWVWLQKNRGSLGNKPIVFWNIGS